MRLLYNANIVMTDNILPGYVIVESSNIRSMGFDVVRMMTLTPAEIIGLGDRKGSIKAGKDADLIVFDENINISGVMVAGKGLLGQLV